MKQTLLIFVSILITHISCGQELALLKISNDSSYFVTEDNKPFFWLGGTAWELIHRLDREQVDQYLTDRANKGFTVIQTVILAELDGLNTPNAYGEKPLLNNNPTKLNDQYFKHVDYVLNKANELGLYIALLPSWGDKFNKKWGAGPEIFNPENATVYGELIARRYLNYNNLIWILGGDRALENENHYKIIRAMAEGIREVDNKHLMSFHPVGGKKATDFLNDHWLDFDMFQSGHSRTAREYSYVTDSRKSSAMRPIINGEARYENIPDRFWEEKSHGWLDDADVRISAYWSVIAGAAGYTYGCNDIWQMYDISKIPIINARTDWQAALQLPGSSQMGYMRYIFEKLPWQKMNLNQNLVLNSNPEDESYILCAIDSDKQVVVAYSPIGNPIKIDLSKIDSNRINAYWFNPRSGRTKYIGDFETIKPQEFKPWASGWGSDFLLILTAESYKINFSDLNK
ncbi:glycoside hydrolase family 140 protein [Carboxylicivirga linearis]|uniref:Glycoside hydrolase family 140 protein n=1 Tax=Carboxylicivirga linearis TaxID=1628157 RepID=A0ABS5K1F0_9BACT|nr:glycoside hydrolase family 140 protein [Carboxylicivirga linearis]MBS2100948.1 glycoside hydrolase family 140 protein [Carboxylicivirga linearis]